MSGFEQLRALIDAAQTNAPGPWEFVEQYKEIEYGEPFADEDGDWVRESIASPAFGFNPPDGVAEFIAAFDPVLCARLLDCADALRYYVDPSNYRRPAVHDLTSECCIHCDYGSTAFVALAALAVVLPEGKPE